MELCPETEIDVHDLLLRTDDREWCSALAFGK
jgi:hypothetical protein